MDNQGERFQIGHQRETVPGIDIQECGRRMAELSAAVSELVKQQATLSAHMEEMSRGRADLRAEIAAIGAWVREQAIATPVILKRVGDVETDMAALENKISRRLDTHDDKLSHLQTIVERMMGIGIAVGVLWAIFGDAIKRRLTGEL